jgi:hypothetical protein
MDYFRKATVALLLLAATLSICESRLTLECAKMYLKDRNVNEDALSFVDSYVGLKTDCESAVKTELTRVTSDLRSKLSGDRKKRPFVECIMRDIEEEEDDSYELLALQQVAIDQISAWRFWSHWSRKSRTEEIQTSLQNIVDKSLLKCQGHRDFGDYFSNILDGAVTWDRSGEEEYCIRTHLVKNNFLNEKLFGFISNPRNVRIEGLGCEPIITDVINSIYQDIQSSQSLTDCRLKAYREQNYALYVLKAEVLSKLTLQKSDKSREKQDFINALVEISYSAHRC